LISQAHITGAKLLKIDTVTTINSKEEECAKEIEKPWE